MDFFDFLNFLLFKVIPVILIIMLGTLGPNEPELSWKTVVAGFVCAVFLITLTTFNFSNKPDEDEANTEKQENNK